jgi:hypothetical protein
MSGGPLAKEALIDGLTAHMAASLQIDAESAEEMDGVRQMALAALDYFASSVRGTPPGSGAPLMWTIYSALLEGEVDQERLNAFFADVKLDVGDLLAAWTKVSARMRAKVAIIPENVNFRGLADALERLPGADRAGPVTVALIPGDLSEADILDVVEALYHQKAAAQGNTQS